MRTNKALFECLTLILISLLATGCRQNSVRTEAENYGMTQAERARPLPAGVSSAAKRVAEAGLEQTKYTFYYDPSYSKINYPGGDVPPERGACTDVVVRAFRQVGVDLQKEVHEDMARNFAAYPQKWSLSQPDTNIDHRRVPNLRTYFERKGRALAISSNPEDYLPGDVVTWDLGGGVDHIGMVTSVWSDAAQRYQMVHNIGSGAKVQNVLFAWRITGHYRYF
jgi:uncharacterized protein YijF (DUF1287 family)